MMVSGLLIPRFLAFGLPMTWALLGGFSLLATVAVAVMMPPGVITPAARPVGRQVLNKPVALLMIGYALCAFGFVPHMLFLASFVAIGLHRGVAAGADVSAVLGVAAALGPPILGRIADRAGFLKTLVVAYLVMAFAVAVPLFTGSVLGLAISAFGVGAIALGAVLLTSGAIASLVAPNRLAANWGLATMSYAVMQAVSAAAFSSLFHATENYEILFGIGTVATFISAIFVLLSERSSRKIDLNHSW